MPSNQPTAGPLALQGAADAAFLCPTQTAVTSTSTGLAQAWLPRCANGVAFELDVTSAATAAGDTLDVFIQTELDTLAAPNWVDVVHFTSVLGNGGAKRYFCTIAPNLGQAIFENGSALGAAALRNLVGDMWRVRYVIVSATSPIFTFNVWARPF